MDAGKTEGPLSPEEAKDYLRPLLNDLLRETAPGLLLFMARTSGTFGLNVELTLTQKAGETQLMAAMELSKPTSN